ncbi:MAG: hypothetical protein HYT73_02300 [Candidatus Aenigmarchaeota archaeon]|nr:hypothetical protein [Candidatus Aenigmarchaeota archaeon]
MSVTKTLEKGATVAELTTKEAPTWCMGCGDFSILSVLKLSIAEAKLDPASTVIVSGIGCLPPEEMVSVGHDWVPISELGGNDVIINGDGKFADIAFKTINHFEGNMIEITPFVSPFNSFRLTPEHPVLCVRRKSIRTRNHVDKKKLAKIEPHFEDAENLEKGDYIVFNWNREVKDSEMYTKDFCRLIGYYLAEGYVNEGGGRNRDSANVSFALNSNEKEIIDDISRLSLVLTGKKPYIRNRENIGNVTEITICSKKLALLLKRICGKGAGNKKVVEEIMVLPAEKQKEIIDAYFEGDGYSDTETLGKHPHFRANTLSVFLAIQMQEMLARSGIFASIYRKKMKPHVYKGRVIRPSGDQYYIAYQPEKEFSSVQKINHGFLIPIKNINKSHYEGLVHNLETINDPHSYLVKGFVVHNCGSKTNHFIKTYGFEGLHGRALPVATGIKIANHNLNVIIVTGDGDGYGIGGNHFIHAARRNLNMTYIIQNNEVYGLTKGQTSPTSEKGFKSNSTPQGALEEPVNPLALAITMGATFVARGYALDIPGLKKMMAEAINHNGFAVVDVFQPCSTYNKINTPDWYKARIFKLDDSYDASNKVKAFEMANTWGDRIPTGVLYREQKPTYEGGLPQISEKPLAEQDIENIDISMFLDRFK